MRAVVTGGLGFVGRHLVDHLLERGDTVTSLDHTGSHAVDITDGATVATAIAEVAPDAVYHLAGWADVGSSWDHPAEVFRVNAEGTLHVLLACIAARVPRACSTWPAPRSTGSSRRTSCPWTRAPRCGRRAPTRRRRSRPRRSPTRRSSVTASRSSGSGRSTTSGPASPSASRRPPSPAGSPGPSGMAAPASRSGTCPLVVISPTSATSYGRTASSWSKEPRGRSTTSAAGTTSRSSRWPTSSCTSRRCPSRWSPTRRCCDRSTSPCSAVTGRSCSAATGWAPRLDLRQTLADLLQDMRRRVAEE